MPKVKICGITSAEDARLALRCGADALGFVFVPDSPRFLTPRAAARITETLPPFVTKVGVFIDCPPERIRRTCRVAGIQIAQLHGSESAEYCQQLKMPYIKTVHVREGVSLQTGEYTQALALLFDACAGNLCGGTGQPFEWEKVISLRRSHPVMLAGGLHAGNVSRAIATVRPYAVDVCSGVEARPGRKDPRKLTAFCRAVDECEKEIHESSR